MPGEGVPMMAESQAEARDHIFISYRRDDARGASGRLYDWLRIGFGRERVFRDVHSIGVGKWRDRIDAALARSAVCVAVIGPRWADADNLPRLNDEGDMVRHELVTALASSDLTLVPTLVEGAEVPNAAGLPSELRPLFEVWNARVVTEEGWEDDTRRLIAEIADATRLAVGPDLDTLLRNAGAAGERLVQLESERHLQVDQIERLRGTVAELTRKLAEAGAGQERFDLSAAFAALSRGDTLAAENAFEREFEARAHGLQEERRAMAEAARNVANLAMLRDVTKAAAFYRKALDAQPDHAETMRMLGQALVALGDLPVARQAYAQSLTLASQQSDSWGEMAAQLGLGDVAVALGSLPEAVAAYDGAMRLAEKRAQDDPANTEWQRDLSVSHERIGDVLVAQGDGPGALAAYRKGLTIGESLAARDPANAQWQTDMAVSCAKLGTLDHGQSVEAQRAYLLRGREILAKLKAAGRLMANQDWTEWFEQQIGQLPPSQS
ncbi:MAG: tetratricopeptide repeat protein [Burkholderiales bacterium]